MNGMESRELPFATVLHNNNNYRSMHVVNIRPSTIIDPMPCFAMLCSWGGGKVSREAPVVDRSIPWYQLAKTVELYRSKHHDLTTDSLLLYTKATVYWFYYKGLPKTCKWQRRGQATLAARVAV